MDHSTGQNPQKPEVFPQVQELPLQQSVLTAGVAEDGDLCKAAAPGRDLTPTLLASGQEAAPGPLALFPGNEFLWQTDTGHSVKINQWWIE